ncbi:MAG: hypothetical protein ACNA8P_00615, partial [Phycisphaerales bacterium]
MSKKARIASESAPEPATTDGTEPATQQTQVAIEASESEQAPPPFAPERIPGAIEALLTAGSDEHKQRYVPHLISGRWTGTMNL